MAYIKQVQKNKRVNPISSLNDFACNEIAPPRLRTPQAKWIKNIHVCIQSYPVCSSWHQWGSNSNAGKMNQALSKWTPWVISTRSSKMLILRFFNWLKLKSGFSHCSIWEALFWSAVNHIPAFTLFHKLAFSITTCTRIFCYSAISSVWKSSWRIWGYHSIGIQRLLHIRKITTNGLSGSSLRCIKKGWLILWR